MIQDNPVSEEEKLFWTEIQREMTEVAVVQTSAVNMYKFPVRSPSSDYLQSVLHA